VELPLIYNGTAPAVRIAKAKAALKQVDSGTAHEP